MKIKWLLDGRHIPHVGFISMGQEIDVPNEIAKALIKQNCAKKVIKLRKPIKTKEGD